MINLKLDGIEVVTSGLTQRAYDAAYCGLLLSITTDNFDEQLKELRKEGTHGKYSGIEVTGIDDLSFLNEFPNLLYLEVFNDNKFDTSYVEQLQNLRGLHWDAPKSSLNFYNFPWLEVFVGDWNKNNQNISSCRRLHQLRIWKYKPSCLNLQELIGLKRLEYLELVQTNITSLKGIEELTDLRYLDIAYSPKLNDISSLSSISSSLREIEFESLKGLKDYHLFSSLILLRKLNLVKCGDIEDLNWINNLKELEQFIFNDSKVISNDLSPLLNPPKLQIVYTNNKKSYNYKCEDISTILDGREL